MELGLGPVKSWKINEMVATFLTRVLVSGLYIHYHCLWSDAIWHGSTALSSNTIKLQLLEVFGKVTDSYAAQSCDFSM